MGCIFLLREKLIKSGACVTGNGPSPFRNVFSFIRNKKIKKKKFIKNSFYLPEIKLSA